MADNSSSGGNEAPIIYEGEPARKRLADLQLTVEIILEAVRTAEIEARRYSDNDPPSARGLARWFKTVRVIRDQLVGDSWRTENPRGLPMTCHRTDRTKVIVTSGDENTGSPAGSPQTRHPKGIATAEATIGASSDQLTIYEIDQAIAEEIRRERARTWILLYHRNESSGQIHTELSNPCETEPGQHVAEWRERIILPEIDTRDAESNEPEQRKLWASAQLRVRSFDQRSSRH